MKKKNFFSVLIILGLLFLVSCSSVVLKPVNYSWALESELSVTNGKIHDIRNGIKMDISSLLKNEFGKMGGDIDKIRMIRNMSGYYFITASTFKNVYVFETGNGKMSLVRKISIDKSGFTNPKFNQRNDYIVFLYNTDKSLKLTEKGILK